MHAAVPHRAVAVIESAATRKLAALAHLPSLAGIRCPRRSARFGRTAVRPSFDRQRRGLAISGYLWQSPRMQGALAVKQRMLLCHQRANPSLHPTAYSGLRPLPAAGELKR